MMCTTTPSGSGHSADVEALVYNFVKRKKPWLLQDMFGKDRCKELEERDHLYDWNSLLSMLEEVTKHLPAKKTPSDGARQKKSSNIETTKKNSSFGSEHTEKVEALIYNFVRREKPYLLPDIFDKERCPELDRRDKLYDQNTLLSMMGEVKEHLSKDKEDASGGEDHTKSSTVELVKTGLSSPDVLHGNNGTIPGRNTVRITPEVEVFNYFDERQQGEALEILFNEEAREDLTTTTEAQALKPKTCDDLTALAYNFLKRTKPRLLLEMFSEEHRRELEKNDHLYDSSSLLAPTTQSSFEFRRSLRLHFNGLSKDTLWNCARCNKRLVGHEQSLKKHTTLHEKVSPCSCAICKKPFAKASLLRNHLKRTHRTGIDDLTAVQYHAFKKSEELFSRETAEFLEECFPPSAFCGVVKSKRDQWKSAQLDPKCKECGEIVNNETTRKSHFANHLNLKYACVLGRCRKLLNPASLTSHYNTVHKADVGVLNPDELDKYRKLRKQFTTIMREQFSDFFAPKTPSTGSAPSQLAQNTLPIAQMGKTNMADPYASYPTVPTPFGSFPQYPMCPQKSMFHFDPTTGYYYDASTGLYFDANTEYFFNPTQQIWMFWTVKYMTFLPVEGGDPDVKRQLHDESRSSLGVFTPGQGPAAPPVQDIPTPGSTGPDEAEGAVEAANPLCDKPKKRGKARKRNPVEEDTNEKPKRTKRQEKVKSSFSKPSVSSTGEYSPKDKAAKTRQVDSDDEEAEASPPPYKNNGLSSTVGSSSAPSTATTATPAPVNKPESFNEASYVDYAKKSCLLSRRAFNNAESLEKHVQQSDLHKKNLQMKRAEARTAAPAPETSSAPRRNSNSLSTATTAVVGLLNKPETSLIHRPFTRSMQKAVKQPEAPLPHCKNKKNALPSSVGSSNAQSTATTAAPASRYKCDLCKCSFGSAEVLADHEQRSATHKKNLQMKRTEARAPEQEPETSSTLRPESAGLPADEAENPVDVEEQAAVKAATPLDGTNIGSKLLKKHGWTEGQGAGKNMQGIVNPIEVERRVQGAGLGVAGAKMFGNNTMSRKEQSR